jgi:hypothetical protein
MHTCINTHMHNKIFSFKLRLVTWYGQIAVRLFIILYVLLYSLPFNLHLFGIIPLT